MDTTILDADVQAPTIQETDLEIGRSGTGAPTPTAPHEEASAILRSTLGQNQIGLVRSRVGLGKTEVALDVLADSRGVRSVTAVESHRLGDEIVTRALAKGIDAAKPMSLEEGCRNLEHVKETLDAGWTRSVACRTCPYRPDCAYLASLRTAAKAQALVTTKATLRDMGGLRRVAQDRDVVIIEEGAVSALSPVFRLTIPALEETRRRLGELDGLKAPGEAARAAAKRLIDGLLGEKPVVAAKATAREDLLPENALARDVPIYGEDRKAILAGRGWRQVEAAFRALVHETQEWNRNRRDGRPARRLPKNVLPQLRAFAKAAGRRKMLWLTAALPSGAWEIRAKALLPEKTPIWLLDATADPVLVQSVLGAKGDRLRVIGGGEALPARMIVVTGQKVYGRASLRVPGTSEWDSGRIEISTDAIATTFRRLGAERPGLISFKALMQAADGSTGELLQGVRDALGMPDMPGMWFGHVRGQDSMRDRDALVIYGTPTPHQDELRSIALLLGASWQDLYENPAPQHAQTGDETFPVFTYRPGPMLLAWNLLVRSEILQAAGRVMRRGQRATIVVFASCLLGPDVIRRSESSLGFSGRRREVVDHLLNEYDRSAPLPGCNKVGQTLGLDDRHLAVRTGIPAARFWREERDHLDQATGRLPCATVTPEPVASTQELNWAENTMQMMSMSRRDLDAVCPVLPPSLALEMGQARPINDASPCDEAQSNDFIARVIRMPASIRLILLPYLTDLEVIQMREACIRPSPDQDMTDIIVDELLQMED